MDRREGIDAPDSDAMAAFAGRASEGPVYMLNLLEFLPDGGAERYTEYGTAVAPILERAGGKPVFAGRAAEALIGEGSWDMVLVVSYPTRQAFIDRHVFYAGRYIGVELLPIVFVDYARPRPMTTDEANELLEAVFSASGW